MGHTLPSVPSHPPPQKLRSNFALQRFVNVFNFFIQAYNLFKHFCALPQRMQHRYSPVCEGTLFNILTIYVLGRDRERYS